MADQFSTTVSGLLTPRQSSSSPRTSETIVLNKPTHPCANLNDPFFEIVTTFDFTPKLVPNPAAYATGRVMIFNTFDNTLILHTVAPGVGLRSIVSASSPYRFHSMPIGAFAKKVDLGEVGVKVGEGQVDEVVKELPTIVVVMRVLGWYQELHVVRSVEAEKAKMDLEV